MVTPKRGRYEVSHNEPISPHRYLSQGNPVIPVVPTLTGVPRVPSVPSRNFNPALTFYQVNWQEVEYVVVIVNDIYYVDPSRVSGVPAREPPDPPRPRT
jgi:hypothetical protein